MATFKVGQRVRIKKTAKCFPQYAYSLGREATILSADYKGFDWELDIPGIDWKHVGANSSALEPLTDPKADAFLEKIRKLKPYKEREPVLIEVGDGLYVMKDGHE